MNIEQKLGYSDFVVDNPFLSSLVCQSLNRIIW